MYRTQQVAGALRFTGLTVGADTIPQRRQAAFDEVKNFIPLNDQRQPTVHGALAVDAIRRGHIDQERIVIGDSAGGFAIASNAFCVNRTNPIFQTPAGFTFQYSSPELMIFVCVPTANPPKNGLVAIGWIGTLGFAGQFRWPILHHFVDHEMVGDLERASPGRVVGERILIQLTVDCEITRTAVVEVAGLVGAPAPFLMKLITRYRVVELVEVPNIVAAGCRRSWRTTAAVRTRRGFDPGQCR